MAWTEWQGVYRRLWAQIILRLVSESDFLPGQDITFVRTICLPPRANGCA